MCKTYIIIIIIIIITSEETGMHEGYVGPSIELQAAYRGMGH
jgi:hypothetical protein